MCYTRIAMLFENSRITCILLKVWHMLAACEIIASYNFCVGEYSAFASWHLASAS